MEQVVVSNAVDILFMASYNWECPIWSINSPPICCCGKVEPVFCSFYSLLTNLSVQFLTSIYSNKRQALCCIWHPIRLIARFQVVAHKNSWKLWSSAIRTLLTAVLCSVCACSNTQEHFTEMCWIFKSEVLLQIWDFPAQSRRYQLMAW